MTKAPTGADSPKLGWLLQSYFYDYLIAQRQASPRTVTAYRDVFRLLLRFAVRRDRRALAQMGLQDLNRDLVLAFLEHLERERCNTARTRNVRLAAIRSFVSYAVLQDPLALSTVQQVLAIPTKRHDRVPIHYLSVIEMTSLLEAPQASTWNGRRDQVLLRTLYNTGARVSEIAALRRKDVDVEDRLVVHLRGKGRKARVIPLWRDTASLLRKWLEELPREPETPLFPNRAGQAMTRSGVSQRLNVAVAAAGCSCPSLGRAKVTPHVIRHTTAMHLLQCGVELSVIALWLGHESIETTHGYVEADLDLKEQALARLGPPSIESIRYRPQPELLDFLDSL